MTIAQEEIFGPVLRMIPSKNEDEAVAIANDTIYGLSADVWAKDKESGQNLHAEFVPACVSLTAVILTTMHRLVVINSLVMVVNGVMKASVNILKLKPSNVTKAGSRQKLDFEQPFYYIQCKT